MSLQVWIPGKLVNPLNSRRHWRTVWAYSRDWRRRTAEYAMIHMHANSIFMKAADPKRVTLNARVARMFDEDGLRAALKPVLDGLCPMRHEVRRSLPGANVIHSDAPDSGHEFVYRQVVDRKRTGVEITVERL